MPGASEPADRRLLRLFPMLPVSLFPPPRPRRLPSGPGMAAHQKLTTLPERGLLHEADGSRIDRRAAAVRTRRGKGRRWSGCGEGRPRACVVARHVFGLVQIEIEVFLVQLGLRFCNATRQPARLGRGIVVGLTVTSSSVRAGAEVHMGMQQAFGILRFAFCALVSSESARAGGYMAPRTAVSCRLFRARVCTNADAACTAGGSVPATSGMEIQAPYSV